MNASNKVLSAIDAVMAEIGSEGISKGRKNQQQNYAFRGIDDVYNALAPILAKHHLIIIPCVQSRELLERSTKGGGALFYVTVQVKWTLASSEDGSSVEAVTYGEAMDTADKATNKAMSAAYKYMAMMTFCIPTEGDNDADATTHQIAPYAAPEPRQAPSDLKRLTSSRAKEIGLDATLKGAIAACMTLGELAEWDQNFERHTATAPNGWLDSIHNMVTLRAEEIAAQAQHGEMDKEYAATMGDRPLADRAGVAGSSSASNPANHVSKPTTATARGTPRTGEGSGVDARDMGIGSYHELEGEGR